MEINKLREQIAKRAAAYEGSAPAEAAGRPGDPSRVDGAQGSSSSGRQGSRGAAKTFHDTLRARISRIESTLKPGERVEVTHDVPDGHCYVEQFEYYGEDMLVLAGHLASGHRCTVFVHVNAVNLCVTTAPVVDGEQRRISFRGDASQHD